MKPSAFLSACLVLAVGFLAGCDTASSNSYNAGPPNGGGTTSLGGVWTSPADVITLRSDHTVTEVFVNGPISLSNPEYRYSGTWSVSGSNLTLSLPTAESSADGTTWLAVPGSAYQGGTYPYSVLGNTMVLDTGVYSTTYTWTSGSGGNPPIGGSVWAPEFNQPSGTYNTALLVDITSATPDAAIFYTKDGSTPNSGSYRYTSPIQVTTTTLLRAVALSAGVYSAVTSVQYDFPSSNSPLVGTWRGIFSFPQGGYDYLDTFTVTLYSGGNGFLAERYSASDPTTGKILGYGTPSSMGTWSATATQITMSFTNWIIEGSYSLYGNSLTIVDPQSTPSTMVFQRE